MAAQSDTRSSEKVASSGCWWREDERQRRTARRRGRAEVQGEITGTPSVQAARGDEERCPRALIFVKSKYTHEEHASDDDEDDPQLAGATVIAQTSASALAACGSSTSLLDSVEGWQLANDLKRLISQQS